jgi:Restriction alleviation protein Lar
MNTAQPNLLPCPFCGGPVKLEEANATRDHILGYRRWWGVVCRNTENLGGSCCMEQRPSASIKAAVDRWNMRDGVLAEAYRGDE